ncbi:MAG TPA: DUF559 domain-containing protein [Gammaproteobacteria bacterium]|nr:DUF559 domain-containing protein [Gammaproteobacteria bacterium]
MVSTWNRAVRIRRGTARLEKRGYRVIRFWNHQVLNDFDAVLDRILEEIDLPHPNLLPEGEGVRNARTTVKADNTDA